MRYLGGRERAVSDVRDALHDYASVSSSLVWEVSAGLSIRISGSNLFNEDIRAEGPDYFVNDVPLWGAQYKAEFKYEL